MDVATTVLANQNRFRAFGNNVAFQLEDMDRRLQVIAEKFISEVLSHGELGNLKASATILTAQPQSNLHPISCELLQMKCDKPANRSVLKE